jgi:hypothetical protein
MPASCTSSQTLKLLFHPCYSSIPYRYRHYSNRAIRILTSQSETIKLSIYDYEKRFRTLLFVSLIRILNKSCHISHNTLSDLKSEKLIDLQAVQ